MFLGALAFFGMLQDFIDPPINGILVRRSSASSSRSSARQSWFQAKALDILAELRRRGHHERGPRRRFAGRPPALPRRPRRAALHLLRRRQRRARRRRRSPTKEVAAVPELERGATTAGEVMIPHRRGAGRDAARGRRQHAPAHGDGRRSGTCPSSPRGASSASSARRPPAPAGSAVLPAADRCAGQR